MINHLFPLLGDFGKLLLCHLSLILKQSSRSRWSFLCPYFLTMALATLALICTPLLSPIFIMYSNDNFPSWFAKFW